jgi:aminoglycoside phosphotransferase (APT) family kinase protein
MRDGRLREVLACHCPGGFAADVRALWDVWDDAVAAPEWEGPPVWLHGDLHPENVVVSD